MSNPTILDTNTRALRTVVNHGGKKEKRFTMKGVERANSLAVAILADAVEDAGDAALAEVLRKVARFLPVWTAHRNRFYSYRNQGVEGTAAPWATDRNKFIALDYGDTDTTSASGCFLVEKATGYVWTIKGYGKKNRICGYDLDKLTAEYEANIAQYDARVKKGERL